MQTHITARHCEVPDDLRARAAEQMTKLARIARRPQRAEVIFDIDHQSRIVELRLSQPRGKVSVATGEANDFDTALDRAAQKLRHQLDKSPAPSTRRSTRSSEAS